MSLQDDSLKQQQEEEDDGPWWAKALGAAIAIAAIAVFAHSAGWLKF